MGNLEFKMTSVGKFKLFQLTVNLIAMGVIQNLFKNKN
jgi:hypothetical protein